MHVVFLRAVNVGTTNRCQPAAIARQLSKFGVINIGAVGTFVVQEDVAESTLRAAIAKKLSFQCEIMICPARDVLQLSALNPFSVQNGEDAVRFVSVLAHRLTSPPPTPLCFPSSGEWGMKVIEIRGRFVLGMYRRQMKATSYLGKFEKQLGVAATTRNWNTIQKVLQALKNG